MQINNKNIKIFKSWRRGTRKSAGKNKLKSISRKGKKGSRALKSIRAAAIRQLIE